MATPNYGYEKRQRELAKKQKKEEKLRAKAANKLHKDGGEGANDLSADDSPAPGNDATDEAGGSAGSGG